MTDEKLKQEQPDEEMINQGFQKLLDTYLATKHRRKGEIITKAFNSANQAHTHKILGLYFDSICDFFGVISIHKLSSSKISSGSQIEFTIFTNFF